MVEFTPYYLGKKDYELNKPEVPEYFSEVEKAEWQQGWNEAESAALFKPKKKEQFLLLESEYGSFLNAAEDEDFTSVAQAEKYAKENDILDAVIVRFEKFV